MIVRALEDSSVLLITQEDHAERSAQFAAHWGNEKFSKLRPCESMVFATLYHDSGYRKLGRITADQRIATMDSRRVRVDPYPFDCSPLDISVRARSLARGNFGSEEECRENYLKARRVVLDFQLTN